MTVSLYAPAYTPGVYSVSQYSTTGSGYGATFDLDYASGSLDLLSPSTIITSPGAGYSINDLILIDGSQVSTFFGPGDVILRVTSVGGSNEVTGFTEYFRGENVPDAPSISTTQSGSYSGGSGATFDHALASVFGSGYIAGTVTTTVTAIGTNSAYDLIYIDGVQFGGVSPFDDLWMQVDSFTAVLDSSCSTIGGGTSNTVRGTQSTIGGGTSNTVCGSWSTVGGGCENTACIDFATVAGGVCNTATNYSSVSGGNSNNANCFSGISSGSSNTTSNYSFIGGGTTNTSTKCSAIGGGTNNCATACSSIGGGRCNVIGASLSTVSGGYGNKICAAVNGGSIVGGLFNFICSGVHSTIGGGCCNRVSTFGAIVCQSTISGGGCNLIIGAASGGNRWNTIAGGECNQISSQASTIGGGRCNTNSGSYSVIGGGLQNSICFTSSCNIRCSSISGGRCNCIINTSAVSSVTASTISAGEGNRICNANHSFIGGGNSNLITCSPCSIIIGGTGNVVCSERSGSFGSSNLVCCVNSYAVGNGITTVSCNTTHVVCLNITSIPTEAALPLPSGTVYRCTTDCTLRIVP
jgi:hypothetical protein